MLADEPKLRSATENGDLMMLDDRGHRRGP